MAGHQHTHAHNPAPVHVRLDDIQADPVEPPQLNVERARSMNLVQLARELDFPHLDMTRLNDRTLGHDSSVREMTPSSSASDRYRQLMYLQQIREHSYENPVVRQSWECGHITQSTSGFRFEQQVPGHDSLVVSWDSDGELFCLEAGGAIGRFTATELADTQWEPLLRAVMVQAWVYRHTVTLPVVQSADQETAHQRELLRTAHVTLAPSESDYAKDYPGMQRLMELSQAQHDAFATFLNGAGRRS